MYFNEAIRMYEGFSKLQFWIKTHNAKRESEVTAENNIREYVTLLDPALSVIL
jgi:hypothetical protein